MLELEQKGPAHPSIHAGAQNRDVMSDSED